jgi:hypothetical protein
MARTAITLTQLAGNSGVAATTTNIDIANGMTFAAGRFSDPVVFVVTNTDASAHVVTITASDPVSGAGKWPNLTYSVPASSTAYLGPFESAKVQQSDGSIQFSFTASHTGTIAALKLPRGF